MSESGSGSKDTTESQPEISGSATDSCEDNQVTREILDQDFEEWYSQFQREENIREGRHYFNGPPQMKSPGEFRASELLKCHRKIYYKHLNAPQEQDDPDGIFWIGTQFEEELAEPFLRDVVMDQNAYVRNGMWASFTLDTDVGEIKVNGSTDPVIINPEGHPLTVSEIKTTTSIEYIDKAKRHHKAQLHAYLYGLSENEDRDVSEGVVLYAARKSLDTKMFHVSFDEEFWSEIKDWLKQNKAYRDNGKLPPADPEMDWECEYCDYKNRCGKGEVDYEDGVTKGFLPNFRDYPREKVVEYLEAHDEAKLTPTLAHEFPELAEEYGAYRWKCNNCEHSYDWDTVDSIEVEMNGTIDCPECEDDEFTAFLTGPNPEDQYPLNI
jgi:CRISPR/Cas system-associated exonuclease Cas4 (RecB family)